MGGEAVNITGESGEIGELGDRGEPVRVEEEGEGEIRSEGGGAVNGTGEVRVEAEPEGGAGEVRVEAEREGKTEVARVEAGPEG